MRFCHTLNYFSGYSNCSSISECISGIWIQLVTRQRVFVLNAIYICVCHHRRCGFRWRVNKLNFILINLTIYYIFMFLNGESVRTVRLGVLLNRFNPTLTMTVSLCFFNMPLYFVVLCLCASFMSFNIIIHLLPICSGAVWVAVLLICIRSCMHRIYIFHAGLAAYA